MYVILLLCHYFTTKHADHVHEGNVMSCFLECYVHILTLALKIPSGEGRGSLPVPGHWRGNEKPFT